MVAALPCRNLDLTPFGIRADYVKSDMARLGKVIKDVGIKVE